MEEQDVNTEGQYVPYTPSAWNDRLSKLSSWINSFRNKNNSESKVQNEPVNSASSQPENINPAQSIKHGEIIVAENKHDSLAIEEAPKVPQLEVPKSDEEQHVSQKDSNENKDNTDLFAWIINDVNDNKFDIWYDGSSDVILRQNPQSALNSLLLKFESILSYALTLVIVLSLGSALFFSVLLSDDNWALWQLWKNNLWIQVVKKQEERRVKDDQIKSLQDQIATTSLDVPKKIYLKSKQYTSLPENLKTALAKYYNQKTWELAEKTDKAKIREIAQMFADNAELNSLKLVFTKEYILNSIIENRLFWKDIYRDLQEVTNKTFPYNDVLNYIYFNNFSVEQGGVINVSWTVTDPSWKVFSQLVTLKNNINEHEAFEWAEISTFQKKLNPDENVGWMQSTINLKFKYINQ